MKLILIVSVLLASLAVTASAADVLDLSTLGKKQSIEAVSLPKVSPTMPTIAPTSLGGNLKSNVLDLSTLGKKALLNLSATMIKGASPITVTPMFAVKNGNVTNQAGSVYTLPQAISANASVYTPPIAIFGGA
jgi:opacity protein-like surface antigen